MQHPEDDKHAATNSTAQMTTQKEDVGDDADKSGSQPHDCNNDSTNSTATCRNISRDVARNDVARRAGNCALAERQSRLAIDMS